tara:strand:+ start:3080 stop:3310 length:231 start_codon:yes stop_codon:yes gene_type:complete
MKVLYSVNFGAYPWDLDRQDAAVIEQVEAGNSTYKSEHGFTSTLAVAVIPDGYHHVIVDYDGSETVYISQSPILTA